jgi:hypothetical protein
MKLRHIIHIFIAILLLSSAISCKKFIDVDPPLTQLLTPDVFNNDNTATAALTSIYAQMSSLSTISTITGLSSDEFIYYGTPPYTNVYLNSLIASDADGLTNFLWKPQYEYIFQANSVIEGLEANSDVSAAVKQQLLGEAKFVRAFWHFYLVNLYGDIPIVTTTDYKKNLNAGRSSQTVVYAQIISDLKEAKELLSKNFVGPDNTPTSERVRPTKWAAMALLARAYLFIDDYTNAEAEATSVINNTATFSIVQDLNMVFQKNSNEAIWQILPPSDITGYNTDEGNQFILKSTPNSSNGVSLSNQLLMVFERDDKRKLNWVGKFTDEITNSDYYFPYKYKIQTGSDLSEYSMVLRLAEQYLIRSEARTQLGRLNEAIDDLNVIRIRAGLPGTTAISQLELLSAVAHERQVELFSEGYRWLDLKRTNKVDEVMENVTPLKGGGSWKSYQQLYPIPTVDIQNSINVKQNPQY